jgi:hypothetical protein
MVLALGALALSSCAKLIGPRVVEVPYTKLQSGLERRFPVNQRLMEVFDVELTQPRLLPQPQPDRLGLALDAGISSPFARQSWRGNVTLSGRLLLDPARQAILLAEPRLERVDIAGMDPARREQAARVINALAGRLVSDLPLYTFRRDELRYAGVQFVPTRLETRADGLALTLEPVRD